MAIGHIRDLGSGKSPIASGTILIDNATIKADKLIAGTTSTTGSCNGDGTGFSTNATLTLSDKLVGRTLSVTYKGIKNSSCFNGQKSWVAQLYDGTGILLKSISIGSSATFTFKVASTTLRINNYLSRTSNSSQSTQVDSSTVTIYSLSVA